MRRPCESSVANELHSQLRGAIRELCARFPDAYWRDLDARREYPDAFVKDLTQAGYLAALIPEEYGGLGLPGSAAPGILVEDNHCSVVPPRRRPPGFTPEAPAPPP